MKKLFCLLFGVLLLFSAAIPISAEMSTHSSVQLIQIIKGESFDRQLTNYYDTLEKAFQNAGSGDVIEVFENVSVSAPITVPAGTELTVISGTKREHTAIFGQSAFEYTDPNAVKQTVTKTFGGALITVAEGSRVTLGNIAFEGNDELFRVEKGGTLILDGTVTLSAESTIRAVLGAEVIVNGETFETTASAAGISILFENDDGVPVTAPETQPGESETVIQPVSEKGSASLILLLCLVLLCVMIALAVREFRADANRMKNERHYYPSVKWMRLILIACAILYTYDLYSGFGDLNGVLFGFAFPALYIISGYLVLSDNETTGEKLVRTIKRTALCFGILFTAFLGLSLIAEPEVTVILLGSKRFWFNFIVLNVCALPIGSVIWFVQALLYAYIIIYFIYKLKLLNMDILIAGVCLVVTLLTGELAQSIGFHLLGYTYFSGNFLTRALPYILIGRFIHRKMNVFKRMRIGSCGIIAFVGFLLIAAEYFILVLAEHKAYIGHLFGMGLIAIAFCLFGFLNRNRKFPFFGLEKVSRFELAIPYFVSSPIYYFFVRLVTVNEKLEPIIGFIGLFTLIASFMVLYLFVFLRFLINDFKNTDE